MVVNLTASVIIGIASAILSAVFTWFPYLNEQFAKLTKDKKQGIMLGLIGGIIAVVIAGGCFGIFIVPGLACNADGISNIVINVLVGLVTGVSVNQGTYQGTKHLAPMIVRNNGLKIDRLGRTG